MERHDDNPFIVIWEVTQACDLACAHCRAGARQWRDPGELTTREGLDLLGQIHAMGGPLLVFTGGDPLKRPDLDELVGRAVSLGLRTSVTPSGTALLDRDAVRRLRDLGVSRLAISLDGPDAATHDAFRRVAGSFEHTLRACGHARDLGLPLQVNTTLSPHNLHLVEPMAGLAESLGAVLWSVFFVVPVGRANPDQELPAARFEEAFGQLHRVLARGRLDVKTTEAPHFRRYLAQRGGAGKGPGPDALPRARAGVGDGRGFVFISHTGDVYPSGFLPLRAGNVRRTGLAELYRESTLFRALRRPDGFKGKCGRCEFRHLCGGSRARAWAATGDFLESDPACSYQPKARAAAA